MKKFTIQLSRKIYADIALAACAYSRTVEEEMQYRLRLTPDGYGVYRPGFKDTN